MSAQLALMLQTRVPVAPVLRWCGKMKLTHEKYAIMFTLTGINGERTRKAADKDHAIMYALPGLQDEHVFSLGAP
jgi:hypothetical protein